MTLNVSDCISIGTITKTHGFNGRVILKKKYNLELKVTEEPVFAIIDGLPVPLFIEELEEKNSDTYIAKFELINTIEKAKEFSGCEIIASQAILKKEKNKFHSQLIGLEIIDQIFGKLGICKSIESTKGNHLMLVETENAETLYIPFVEEWIAEFKKNNHLIIKCPDGLLTINS